jgi:hypothetical protein
MGLPAICAINNIGVMPSHAASQNKKESMYFSSYHGYGDVEKIF